MKKNTKQDLAHGVGNGLYLEPLDVFTCGEGLYAVMYPSGKSEMFIMAEIVNIKCKSGKKLMAGLKNTTVASKDKNDKILDDYCFIATPDIVVQDKAQQRLSQGVSNASLDGINAKKDARSLDEIELVLGCSILEHLQAKEALYVHKQGIPPEKQSGKRETDVAQSVDMGLYFEAQSLFTCGLGLFAIMAPVCAPEKSLVAEIIDIDGRQLSVELKYNNVVTPFQKGDEILDDYCFLISNDILAVSKAQEIMSTGVPTRNPLSGIDVKEARHIDELELVLGCPLLEHAEATKMLLVHKWGVIG